MDIPVFVGNRLRFRLRRHLIRRQLLADGWEVRIWGHPALLVAMTPAGLEFSQLDWYTFTISYKRRRCLSERGDEIEPARLLLGAAAQWLGFVYVAIYLSDWPRMFGFGELPLEVGRLGLDARKV